MSHRMNTQATNALVHALADLADSGTPIPDLEAGYPEFLATAAELAEKLAEHGYTVTELDDDGTELMFT